MDDAIPADHQVRLLLALFEMECFQSVFAEMDASQRQVEGNPGYSPRMLAQVVVYCSMIRIRSSRQIEAACVDRLDLRWLAEGQLPDHSTIFRFRRRQRAQLKKLLTATIRAAREAGLATLRQVAVDGTFIEANASRGSVRERDAIEAEIREIEAQVDAMLDEHDRNDEAEEAAAKRDQLMSGDSSASPEQRKRHFEERLARLRSAVERTIERQEQPRRKDLPPPKPIASTTDPDCRHMKDKEGRCKPNYNVQVAVDADSGMVVAADVNDQANDTAQLKPMVDAVRAACGEAPGEVLCDAGYHTGRVVTEVLESESNQQGPQVYVSDPQGRPHRLAAEARAVLEAGGSLSLQQLEALPRNGRGCFHHASFVYDNEADCYRCPAGEALTRLRRRTRRDRIGTVKGWEYGTTACATCRLAARCHRSKEGRRITRDEFDEARERMLARTCSEEGRARSVTRMSTVEPTIGRIKVNMDLRRFLHRGREAVGAELDVTLAAMNIAKLIRHMRPALLKIA